MNAYTFDDIRIDQEEQFDVLISDRHMKLFSEITGDVNPLHTNCKYAQSQGHKGSVVYGMLTASYLSTLAGMYLPGEHSLIHEVGIKFVSPVILDCDGSGGGMLTVKGKVVEKQELFKRLVIKVRITDVNDELVLRATMKVGVLK